MTVKRKPHYINNKDLFAAMKDYKARVIEWRASEKENPEVKMPRIPEYIGQCFMLIAGKLSKKPNFVNYSYRDEMISDGIENCIRVWENFDETKRNNPFAYFTQIIGFAFIRRIDTEKKQQYIKIKNVHNSIILGDMYADTDDFNGGTNSILDNEVTNDFVRAYENKLTSKKNAIMLGKSAKKSVEPL